LASFTIHISSPPERILITSDGERFILIDYQSGRGNEYEVVQVLDRKGNTIRRFTLSEIYTREDAASFWKHEKGEFSRWVDEAYLFTGKHLVLFRCADILPNYPVHDYALDLDTLKVTIPSEVMEPNQLPDPSSPTVTPPAKAGGAPSVTADH
jgi:hypothetical protein